MIVRVIKDILIILYILVMPMWLMELLGIDMYFYRKRGRVNEFGFKRSIKSNGKERGNDNG